MSQGKITKSDNIIISIFSACCVIIFLFQFGLVPYLRSRIQAGEIYIIPVLRSIATSQSQFACGAYVDQDGDGIGEYGYFQELCGESRGRMKQIVKPTFLHSRLGTKEFQGIARYKDYYLCIYLPGTGRETVPVKKLSEQKIIDQQEMNWVCYAWPVELKEGGYNRVFAINIASEVYASANIGRYHGLDKIPKATAAMSFSSKVTDDFFGPLVLELDRGMDGDIWVPVGGR